MPDEPHPPLIQLQAGIARAFLDDVDLREVGQGAESLLDRVYVAVRARDWSTVPGVVSDLEVDVRGRSFDVAFTSRHRLHELDFVWRGRLVGLADGTIECHLDGEARTDFEYCRIGFCVHHPDRLAGAAYAAWTEHGEVRGSMPRLVAPQLLGNGGVVPPIPHFERLSVTSSTRQTVIIESTGEPFELEDQRNWTDASFKSYIPPIAPGYPYRARRGQRFTQHIRISFKGPQRKRAPSREAASHLDFPPLSHGALPAIGFGLPDPVDQPDPNVLERLTELRPDHVRLSAWVGRPAMNSQLDRAIEHTLQLGCSLEVALFVDPDDEAAIHDMTSRVAVSRIPVDRWLVFDAKNSYRSSTSLAAAALVRAALDEFDPGAILAAGTAADFVWLNRDRTLYADVDALAWAIQPSRHASDDRSVMENATAQGVTVETARSFAGGRSLCVGPVELVRRPAPADSRQRSALAAAWTVASLADLCASAPTSITYFETSGERGLIDDNGEPYPVYHVFEAVARMRGGAVRPAMSSDRRAVVGLAVDHSAGTTALVANLTLQRRRVELRGLWAGNGGIELGPYEVMQSG